MSIYRMIKSVLRIGAGLVLVITLLIPQTAAQADTYTVTNTNNSGLGSLRQAIADANANTGGDVIEFNIPTATDPKCGLYLPGVCTIELSSALVISDNNTYIYGNTQSANQGDTNLDGLEIEVRGMTRTFPVFTITSDSNILSFMSITGGSIGVEIKGDSNSNTLNTNTIGLDAAMATKVPNSIGVQISGGSDLNLLAGNVIAGNTGSGVEIFNSSDNDLWDNFIGTDGVSSSFGNGTNGIFIDGTSSGNTIGGSESDRNVISGNSLNGIWIDGASGNTISYNHIGTDYPGSLDLGNLADGVYVSGGADTTSIRFNQISGNHHSGVYITGTGTDFTSVYNNIIGSDLTTAVEISNDQRGVAVMDGSTSTTVQSNVIVGSGWSGLMLYNTNGNFVLSNLIGIGYNPEITNHGNGLDGIFIGGTSTGNIIGGSVPGRNVISCNYQHGIQISGASDNEISYNHIGTDYYGSLDLGNLNNGVYVTGGADDIHIEHNVISGNGQHGVYIKGTGIERTIITSNRIGSNADGDAVIANDYHGIVLEGEAINNGPTGSSITDNIIIGSGWTGLVFLNAPKNETFYNYIGVSPDSDSTNLGNVFFGIHVLGSDNTFYWDTIANNGLATSSAGIRVDGSTALSNALWPISIYNNGGKGIENINGGNAGLLGPVFDAEHTCTHVSGTIPEPLGYVDIYTGPDDEGKVYKGSAFADGSGHFEYTGSIAGPYVSAKWTDSAGNTSEFSAMYICGHTYLPVIMKP